MSFERNHVTGTTMARQDFTLGAVPGASPQALWREMEALSLAIKQGMDDIGRFYVSGQTAEYLNRSQDVRNLQSILDATRTQFVETAHDQDIQTVLDTSTDWLENQLPHGLAAIPNALLEAIRQIGLKAGSVGLQLSLPLIGLGLAALWLLSRAERTRSYRKYVA